MFSRKVLKYLSIIIVVLIIFSIVGKKSGWFGGNKPILVSIEKVQKRTILEMVTANGKIQPETEVKISADVSGEIVQLYVKEGEAVKKGQELLKIKPDIYLSAKDRAIAAVNTTKANYENALARLDQTQAQFKRTQLAYERNKKLWEQQTISQADWDASTAEFMMAKADVEASKQNVKSAEFGVKSAEASLKEADERLMKTTVFAPMDGIVARLSVEQGERVAGTDLMAGSELLTVADLKRMEVKVDVNENDIVRVKTGDTALIEVDAYLDQKFKGVITEIANSANISGQASADQVTSFEVKIIMLENSYKQLITGDRLYPFRPGMTATVDIQTLKKSDVFSIPIEAVTTRSDSALKIKSPGKDASVKGKSQTGRENEKINEIVFIKDKQFARIRKVKTGIQDNTYIEITDGLKESDEVISAPYSAISRRLKDSVLIKVVDKKELFNEK
jgi:HlyD family secretion protein